MLSLDLFDSKYEKKLHEGAVDSTIEHLIKPLSLRAAEIRTQLRSGRLEPKQIDQLEKEYEELVQKRLDIILDRQPKTEQQQPQRPPAKGLLKGKDLITPQQRVAGATPAKSGISGAVKDVVGGIKRFVKGEPDQGPTYEARQKKNLKPTDVKVARELQKIRAQYPTASSDLEALARYELDSDEQANSQINQLERVNAQQSQQLEKVQAVNADLAKNLQSLNQTTAQLLQKAPAAPAEPPPTTPAPAAVKPEVEPAPAEVPPVIISQLPKKDQQILKRVQSIQKRLQDRVDQYQTVRALKDTEKMEKMQKDIADLQDKIKQQTAQMSDAGQQAATAQGPGAEVIDITSRLKQAGLDLPRTGTLGEQESPVIGAMAQQLSRAPSQEEIYNRNMTAFTKAYEKTRGSRLNYGHSASIPLPFSDMDALVSTISAFPPEQKSGIWRKLFTDPTYLNQFLAQYVKQRGLIEADVIPLAQQRQAPAQLKAYDLALEILKAAKDPKVSTDKIDLLKQRLFQDFGTRIQRHPQGHYYITFAGRQIKLPDPKTFALEHGGGIGPKQHWQDLMPEQRNPEDYDDADEFGMPGSEFFPDDDDRLRDGDYVRDRQDGESGEIFRMSGDPTERRVRILDRDGKGWYISPERLVAVDRDDPDIMRYFGKRRQRDMDEGWSDAVVARRTGKPRTPYSVYIDGREWKTFANDDHAQAVAEKVRANLKRQGRDQTVTIAPSQAYLSGQVKETKEPINQDEYFAIIDRLDKEIGMEQDRAVRQMLMLKRGMLEKRAEAAGWIPRKELREDTAALAAEDAILKRIFVKRKDLMMEYGPDKITQAAESVAYNVGDIAHITDEQINEWVGQVEYILGARP